jgi:phage terminase large subunit GpA-like protein
MARPHRLFGLASSALALFGALAAAATPNIARSTAQWAQDDRWVAAESGSARPGKWENENSPLAIEPMEALSFSHPCTSVTVSAAAQLFKSEIGVNWLGSTICDDPSTFLAMFPTIKEVQNFNNTKFQPTVDVTPALQRRVQASVERSRSGSTSTFKRFRGGYALFVAGTSSTELQAKSIKRFWCDEVSELPMDAGGRGDPLKQIWARTDGQDEFKGLFTSTPGVLPNCRITALYNAGDRSKYYIQCPHCSWFQVLYFENMVPPPVAGGRVTFRCLNCEDLMDDVHKRQMVGNGRRWIRTYPSENPDNPSPPDCFPPSEFMHWRERPSEGRNPSYWAWQGYSFFKNWSRLWGEYETAVEEVKSGRDPEALKVFSQQKLGLAYDAASEAPDHQKLFEMRGRFVKRGVIPAFTCQTILSVDIQGDRIEWDAYAIGPCLSLARFDWGVIEVDPLDDDAWFQLNDVIGRRWPGEATVDLGFDIVGIDSGGKKGVTERVYRFVRNRHNVLALKGVGDPDAIPLNKGKRQKLRTNTGYVSCDLWLVGVWGLKSVIYTMLDNSLQADGERMPNAIYNPFDATAEDFKQYVAEVFKKPKSMRAGVKGWWDRLPGQANERLDLAVYARALAWKLGCETRTPAEWQELLHKRLKQPEAELPLFAAADFSKPLPVPTTAENPGLKPKSLFSGRTKL